MRSAKPKPFFKEKSWVKARPVWREFLNYLNYFRKNEFGLHRRKCLSWKFYTDTIDIAHEKPLETSPAHMTFLLNKKEETVYFVVFKIKCGVN